MFRLFDTHVLYAFASHGTGLHYRRGALRPRRTAGGPTLSSRGHRVSRADLQAIREE
jgi:hypothetical protein